MGNTNRSQTPTPSNVSSSSNPSPSHRFMKTEESTEQFILIWLDGHCEDNSLDTLRTKTLFRQLNNDRCLFINNIDQFFARIEIIKNENKKILVVVSGLFAQEILSKTIDILSSIIIFCRDYNKYAYLLNRPSNLIDICTEYEALKNCIKHELPSLKFNLFANQKLTSLRSLNDGHDNSYFSYMLFINFLKHMPQTKQAKDIMLNKCRDFYRRDEVELKRIEKFRNEYTPNQAIDWYKQDAFVYRLVNRAFRTEDVTLWYLFRFFIVDLCTQLESIHQQQNIQGCLTLYRGQGCLPINELEYLKSNIGGLVSSNGFFSASKDIDIARSFITGSTDSDESKVVIFQINLDANNLKNVIFVDIDRYTDRPDESEILFNIGSVFQVENVNYDEDLKVWIIQMKATDEGTHTIKERLDTMQKKFQNGNINLLFGRLLLDMKQYSKADSYFQMMSQVLPRSHAGLSSVYDHLGDSNMQTTNWNDALKNFSFAYEIKKKKRPINQADLGVSLNNLGNYSKAIGDHEQALEYYQKALICKNNPYNRAVTLLNLSAIYLMKNEYQLAYDSTIQAREIFEKYSSSSLIPIIQCQGIIGSIYFAQKDYDIAKEFYFIAFEMSQKYLFIDDRYRITCIKALANVYQKENLKQQAIDFCCDQWRFYQQYLTENHVNLAYLLMIIAELYDENEEEKIEFLEKALRILHENIYQQYAITADCLMAMGNYYHRQDLNNKAKLYYIRAFEIQKKIYPKNHSILEKTQGLIKDIEN